jgi:hypothetical protein
VGNIGSGKSSLADALHRKLEPPRYGIDACRIAHGDGSASGEAAAWSAFLRAVEREPKGIFECSGTGSFAGLLGHAMKRLEPWEIGFIDTPIAVCAKRVAERGLTAPYPDFGVPIGAVLEHVERSLTRDLRERWPEPIARQSGEVDRELELPPPDRHHGEESTRIGMRR